MQKFADDLTVFASDRLSTPAEYITIDYTEVPEAEWKARVWDTDIAPNREYLLRKPEYEL